MPQKNIDSYEKIFSSIIEQKFSNLEIKNILLEINSNGFSKEVFVGAMRALKSKMKRINALEDTIDVCGTGGDKLNSLNISTAVCFVVAAFGVSVAKHGNKAISSSSGSADVLSELGIKFSNDEKQVQQDLLNNKICFLFAPFFHESLKNLAKIRKEIALEYGVPTIFNYLGPLVNPANVKTQFIGTSKQETMLPMLEALQIEGSKNVYIVNGFDNMDEISLSDNSNFLKMEDGKIFSKEIINPENFGFKKISLKEIIGSDAKYNASKMIELFEGVESAYFDIVVLNAAFVFKLAKVVKDVESGIILAKKMIKEGRVLKLLKQLQLNN